MSTSLSAVQNQVRKRFGFKADTNELSDDGNRVLDEQGAINLRHTLRTLSSSLIRVLQNRRKLSTIFGTK